MSRSNELYDLVLENGRYLTGRRLEPDQQSVDGLPIVHRLRLRWWHRLPVTSAILRNMWAKSHGAQLYEPPA